MKNYNKVFYLLLIFALFACTGTKESNATPPPETDTVLLHNDKLSMIFVGDIMTHKTQTIAAWDKQKEVYDYSPAFDLVKEYFDSVDLVVGNLETTFGREPYTGYPTFSAPDELAPQLKKMGIDILTTANNHCCDRGDTGLVRTLDILDQNGIPSTGTFRNQEDRERRNPLMIDTLGYKIGLLAYTYGTNGLKYDEPVIVNLIDTVQIKEDIKASKEKGAELVLVSIHWGEEYQLNPNWLQIEQAQYIAENGADAIIGSHPHVVQRSDTLVTSTGKQVPILYSLGNFVSNQYQPNTRLGKMLQLEIERVDSVPKITFWKEHKTFVARKTNRKYRYLIVPVPKVDKWLHTFSKEDANEWKKYEALLKKDHFK